MYATTFFQMIGAITIVITGTFALTKDVTPLMEMPVTILITHATSGAMIVDLPEQFLTSLTANG